MKKIQNMDNYKKIIKSKQMRLKILRFASFIPDYWMIRLQYRIKMGRKLNLKNPRRYTEKVQWYKLYYHDPLMTKCADKYAVREYVQDKGFADILNELYAVYDSPDQIREDELPDKFVIKITSGCGENFIVTNKSEFNLEAAKKQMAKWMANNRYGSIGREWPYYNIKPRIIVEKYLTERESGLIDYKFFCFNGKVSHSLLISDRFLEEKIDLYSADWERMKVIQSDCPRQSDFDMLKPENYDKMIHIAEKLSEDFPHVRVDLYNINGKIYFGELTFFSGSGYYIFEPDIFDFELGDKFILPEKRIK